jgi:hypothetical protein
MLETVLGYGPKGVLNMLDSSVLSNHPPLNSSFLSKQISQQSTVLFSQNKSAKLAVDPSEHIDIELTNLSLIPSQVIGKT